MNQESISKMAAALQQVAENKLNEFEIPETIQAAERTAFHGAAAGAHKAGKSHFNFAGKKYPVTMKKDTAKAIADDVKEASLDEISRGMRPMSKSFGKTVDPKKFDAYKKHMKTHNLDEPTVRMAHDDPDHGESKRMMKNPKYAKALDLYKKSMKEEVEESKNMALAKKLAKASASSEKGKKAVTLKKAPFDIPKASKNEEDEVVVNPKKETKKAKMGDNEVSAVESTVWPVYTRIMEKRGEHYKSAAAAQEPNDASKSSKGAQDMLNTPKDVKDNPEASGDDVKKAANAGPSKKARTNDNKAGDSKVIPSATKA
jgi:hypothetical protein